MSKCQHFFRVRYSTHTGLHLRQIPDVSTGLKVRTHTVSIVFVYQIN